MEYAKVDKSKKRTSQEEDTPAAGHNDAEVENKVSKVSVHNVCSHVRHFIKVAILYVCTYECL